MLKRVRSRPLSERRSVWHDISTAATVLLAMLHVDGHELALIRGAGAAEAGSVLKELGIAPITDQERLLELGCRDAMKITKKVRPVKTIKQGERLFRHYQYRGMELSTEAVEVEDVLEVKIDASKLTPWGVVSQFPVTLGDVSRKFGQVKQIGYSGTGYGDERFTVQVHFKNQNVTHFLWLCD